MEIVNSVLVKKTVLYCKYTPPQSNWQNEILSVACVASVSLLSCSLKNVNSKVINFTVSF